MTSKDINIIGIKHETSWQKVFEDLINSKEGGLVNNYLELIGYNYTIDPENENIMSYNKDVLDFKKLAAMYKWYMSGNRWDHSIEKYFDEYKGLTSGEKPFNSNYGYYTYIKEGLSWCLSCLLDNIDTRHAIYYLGNDEALRNSNDPLCTNSIQFFIKNHKLEMIVNMRSSNFITLLPYDSFMFSLFYCQLYNALKFKNSDSHRFLNRGENTTSYDNLHVGHIHFQVGSLHMYKKDFSKIKNNFDNLYCDYLPLLEFGNKNFENTINKKLNNILL